MRNKYWRVSGRFHGFAALLLAAVLLTGGCAGASAEVSGEAAGSVSQNSATENSASGETDGQDIPAYTGAASVSVNGNTPLFTEKELAGAAASYEYYPELDALGRCGACMASVGQDLMPTEERGDISAVHPSGWHSGKDPAQWNRGHLIGFQLSGENDNEKNLITMTRAANEEMIPYENMIADYVKETGNHVLYRVTPVFEGDNLVASGVRMEAESVEDQGEGIFFYIYCYNVQPGVEIDYATGDSWETGEAAESGEAAKTGGTVGSGDTGQADNTEDTGESSDGIYIVNKNNGKIHISGKCSATDPASGTYMKNTAGFDTYNEAEAYSESICPEQTKRKCGNCW